MPKIAEAPGRSYRIPAAQMSPAQVDLVQRIMAGPRKDLPVNMEIWLHSPGFAEVANDFAEYVGHRAPMTRRVKEITILAVASCLGSAFEWFWHARLARQLGVTDDQLAALESRQGAAFEDPAEQTACDLAAALVRRQPVDDELYGRAMRHLGRDGVADLIGLIGLYVMVAYSLDFYAVPLPSPAEAA